MFVYVSESIINPLLGQERFQLQLHLPMLQMFNPECEEMF
jgi:hypothetical protein